MVEDIWMAVDQHANISKDFTDRAQCFREKNFVEARRLIADEIARCQTYVPDYLNFEGVKGKFNQSNLQGSSFNQTNSVYQNNISHSQIQAPQVHNATAQNNYY